LFLFFCSVLSLQSQLESRLSAHPSAASPPLQVIVPNLDSGFLWQLLAGVWEFSFSTTQSTPRPLYPLHPVMKTRANPLLQPFPCGLFPPLRMGPPFFRVQSKFFALKRYLTLWVLAAVFKAPACSAQKPSFHLLFFVVFFFLVSNLPEINGNFYLFLMRDPFCLCVDLLRTAQRLSVPSPSFILP